MIPAMKNKWALNRSPLYRHLKQYKITPMGELFLTTLINGIKEGKELACLRDDTGLLKLLYEYYFLNRILVKQYTPKLWIFCSVLGVFLFSKYVHR